MCVISSTAAITAGAALSANLAIASTAASIGMAAYSQNAQAQQAQATMNMQAQQSRIAQQQQRDQMIVSQQNQRLQMIQAQQLQRSTQELQISQQQEQQRFAASQQLASQTQQQRQQDNQYNLTVLQSNNQIQNQYNQQIEQVKLDRQNTMDRNTVDRLNYQRAKENKNKQVDYNNQAANKMYETEQTKLDEARKKAAFGRQANLAKMIGSKGAILAAGRSGNSIGLLVNDAERQAGFATAQSDATLESAISSAGIGMDTAFAQSQSANQRAENAVPMQPLSPYLPAFPSIPSFVDPFKLDNYA